MQDLLDIWRGMILSNRLFLPVLMLGLSMLVGCNDTIEVKKIDKTAEWDKKQTDLGIKYKAIADWESELSDAMTLKSQQKMQDNIVLFKGYNLEDAYEKDGLLYLKFDGYDGFYLILNTTMNSSVAKELISKDVMFKNMGVVAKVKKVSVPLIKIDPQIDGEHIEVEIKTGTEKLVYGEILDVVIEE
jgi:hypothetical protein